MKKTLLALMMLSAAAAYAGEAEDRLLSRPIGLPCRFA